MKPSLLTTNASSLFGVRATAVTAPPAGTTAPRMSHQPRQPPGTFASHAAVYTMPWLPATNTSSLFASRATAVTILPGFALRSPIRHQPIHELLFTPPSHAAV